MQGRGRSGPPPIGIAFEGDIGRRIDAVMAVAMLNGLTSKGEARRIALTVSRTSIESAQLADVLSGFYSPRPVGGSSMVGMPETGPAADAGVPLTRVLARPAADGTPVHTSNIATLLDTADNAVLIRNMLLAQVDGNAAIVLAGPATGVVRLMNLFGARPQIEAKVARLVVAVGAYPSGAADPSVAEDVAAARQLFAEWPTEIVAAGTELGQALAYPGASIDTDMAWSSVHPVADAYRLGQAMPYDAPSMALAATLFAAHPDAGYFRLSEPGTISVLDDGKTTFTAGDGGRHRYLQVDPARKNEVLTLFRELVAAEPAPRPGRRGAPPPPPDPPRVPPVAPPAASTPTP